MDRHIRVTLPDRKGRADMLAVHSRPLLLENDLDLDMIAGSTSGFSGAQIAALCNEAALLAARSGSAAVTAEHFARARDRMLIGQTSGHIRIEDQERRIVAWHEAGHAVAAALLDTGEKIEKVTILPQGGALGFVLSVPTHDQHLYTRRRLKDRMTVLAAGRAAEELLFGDPDHASNGASGDIEALTRIATEMVTRYGMGKQGFVNLAHSPDLVRSAPVQAEIREISEEALTRAKVLLKAHRGSLDRIAKLLLSAETIKGSDVLDIVLAADIELEAVGEYSIEMDIAKAPSAAPEAEPVSA